MANVENFRYEIDELNAVRIWDDNITGNGNHPMIFQPDYPDGKPFEDAAAAEAWAVAYLTEVVEWHKNNPAPVEETPVE